MKMIDADKLITRLMDAELDQMQSKTGEELCQIVESMATVEQTDDAISRQAAISDIHEMSEWHTGDAFNADRVIRHLKDLPSVTPKQRSGHNCNEDYADCDQFVCSECGIELQDWHRIERDEDDGEITCHEYVMKYCPNCGAKMIELQESEG